VVSPTANSSYTVVGTSLFGCLSSNTATSNITVNSFPLPVVSVNNGTICSGNSFNIIPSGANTYTIQGGSSVVSPTANSSYTFVGTSTAGCVSANTATSHVTVNPLPTVIAVTSATNNICVGQSATLTASGASSYTWNPGGIGTSISVSPTVTSTYTVTGADANGCQSIASITQSVSTCTGINDKRNKLSLIEIYPNPANEVLSINLGHLDLATVKIEVMNSIGQVVLISDAKSNQVDLNVSELSSGIYFIKMVQNGKESINQKFIKN